MKRIVVLAILSINTCLNVAWCQQFRFSIPPDSIVNRQARINYMVENYWTNTNLKDTTNFTKPKILMDYLYLLRQADISISEISIMNFIIEVSQYDETFSLIIYWLDNILYDSTSPQYNEQLYLKFLNVIINSDIDSARKIFPTERIKIMQKNQVDSIATNFCFTDRNDRQSCLYDYDSPLILLFFNNPDCSLCHQAEKEIERNDMIQHLISSNQLLIIAITPDADMNTWLAHKYPDNWIVGIDKEKVIYNQRLYDIQWFPSIYLLDKDKRVLLKEANYNVLAKYIEEHHL